MKSLQEQIKDLKTQLAELEKKVENQAEFTYPIYCRGKSDNSIWEIHSLTQGVCIKKGDFECSDDTGYQSEYLKPHTDTEVWEVLPICPKRGFYHKQRVWAWDDNHTHNRHVGFYNALLNKMYSHDGRIGYIYQNYEAVTTPWEDWQIEAFKTLE